MYLPKRYLLLALTAIPLVTVGCSASRRHLSQRDSIPTRINEAEPTLDTITSPETRDVPEVQTVAFRDHETDEGIEDSADSAILFAVPDVVEGFAMSESGLTLEAIDPLASSNNPAIQQANAASAIVFASSGSIRRAILR